MKKLNSNDEEVNFYKPPSAPLISDSSLEDEVDDYEQYKKVLTFKGRMGRIRFLYTTLSGLAMAIIMTSFWGKFSPLLMAVALAYYCVKMPWVFAASSVRRFHDLNKPSHLAWLALIPPVFIWLAIVPGDKKANPHGAEVFKPTTWEYLGVFFTLAAIALVIILYAL